MYIAKDLIDFDIPALKPNDTGLTALSWMDEYKVSHLPVVDGDKYYGIVSDIEILDHHLPEEKLIQFQDSFIRPIITEGDHIYQVIKQISLLKLSLIPVVDANEKFIGIITLHDLAKKLATMASIDEPGGIIVLEIKQHDYLLSQISQIVESNDARILSSNVTSQDSNNLEVTLKINVQELSGIIQTFNRYNYTIKASIFNSQFADDVKQRYGYLMNYLDL